MFKKIMTGIVAFCMLFSLAACGSSKAMSKEEYEEAVAQIGVDIYSLSDVVANIDSQDAEDAKSKLEDAKKSFSDFLDLVPPKEYEEAHEKIKAGCQAIVDMIDKSGEALQADSDTERQQITNEINQSLENALYNLIEGSNIMSK